MTPSVSERRREAMTELRGTLTAALDEVVPRGSSVALLDVPIHSGFGDWIIWAATESYLADRECTISYRASRRDCDWGRLRRHADEDTLVLCHGGGNFGDLYPAYQGFREAVLRALPGHRVVLLPQTIHYRDPARMSSARDAVGAHPRCELLVRDRPSLELARQLSPKVRLVPDMAHVLYDPARKVRSTRGPLCIFRADREAEGGASLIAPAGERVGDWASLLPAYERGVVGVTALSAWLCRRTGLQPHVQRHWLQHCSSTVERMLCQVERHKEVYTDRLHGMLAALLVGRPVSVADNNYNKLGRYHDCWLQGVPECDRREA